MRSKLCFNLLVAGVIGAAAVPASAQVVYVASSNGQIGKLDVLTGGYTLINASPGALIGGLGFHSGVLYGLDSGANLDTINQTTGQATLVGPTGQSVSGGWGLGATNDGAVYMQGDGQVSTVNLTSGASTPLPSSLGFATGSVLAGDPSGNLYIDDTGNGNLYSVNRSTGAPSLIGTMSALVGQTPDALCWTDGALYAITLQGGIYRVSVSDASAVQVANFSVGNDGAIWAAASNYSATTPEPFTLALCVAGLGLAGRRMRQRTK